MSLSICINVNLFIFQSIILTHDSTLYISNIYSYRSIHGWNCYHLGQQFRKKVSEEFSMHEFRHQQLLGWFKSCMHTQPIFSFALTLMLLYFINRLTTKPNLEEIYVAFDWIMKKIISFTQRWETTVIPAQIHRCLFVSYYVL